LFIDERVQVPHVLDHDDDSIGDDSRDDAPIAFKSRGITHARPIVTFVAASHAFYMFRPQPAHHANARFVASLFAASASAREHAGDVARAYRDRLQMFVLGEWREGRPA